jgi:ElaA protein
MTPDWRFARFDELSPRDLYDILQLRTDVFVMEQDCVFQDMDGVDTDGWHLFARVDGRIVAYCRFLGEGVKFAEPSIGRVVTAMPARGTGLGRLLMVEAIRRARALWPGRAIRIGAQQRLERFYRSLGFVTDSAPYDEDGIPHVEMRLGPGDSS